MSEKLPNMLETTIQKIRDMVDANTVVGQPITTSDGTTILPVSKISIGLGGGGSDFASSKAPNGQMPFGGGAGGGVKVIPVAFLIVKDGSVRILPISEPASTTADRVVDMVPDVLDKVSDFIDSHTKKE